jgi:hypothetical protein
MLIESQAKGLEMFKHVSLNQLPGLLRSAVKIGWYEGSGFFLMLSKRFTSLVLSPSFLTKYRHSQLQVVTDWPC